MHRPPTLVSLAAMAGIALFLSGCGQAANATLAESSPDPAQERLSVVAATSVYGDLARTIGGDRVHVTSIISGTSQDPHSYEPTPQDKLAVSKADLAIGNGGGFDPFFDTITKDSGLSQDRIIHAFDVAGVDGGGESHTHGHSTEDAHGEINEHVWYNMSAASRIADEIATRLGAVDPEGAAVFADNAEKFTSDTAAIADKLTVIKTRHSGEGVALTEPLPLYILEAAGLENRTPEDFLEAAEEGSDVPADALKSTVDLVSSADVRFLAYGAQTSTPQTEAVRKAAEAANLPVVNFTETLPEGKTFVQWMNENADNIESALRR
jgi:zinc/manganese transport system substrate-binding protein